MGTLTDNSIIPYGKYKGTKMANIPADYLLWVFDNNKCSWEVAKYVNKNYDVLKEEVKRNKQ